MTARGIRNKNPLNLRPLSGGDRWQGQTGIDRANDPTGAGYCVFADWAYGIRAAVKLLGTYQRKYGLNTIQGVINRWAPAADNNHVGNYVSRVSRLTGIAPDATLDLMDALTVGPMVDAMARVELGISDHGPLPYPQAQKLQGMELAGLDVPQSGVRTTPTADPVKPTAVGGIATVGTAVGGGLVAIAENSDEIVAAVESSKDFGDLAGTIAPWLGGLVVILAIGFGVWRAIKKRREATI